MISYVIILRFVKLHATDKTFLYTLLLVTREIMLASFPSFQSLAISMQRAQCVLLFLVLVADSAWF